MPVYRLQFSSRLASPPDLIWRHASSMSGVNRELWPLGMSAPGDARIDEQTPIGVVVFHSVISLLGIVPLDLHALCLNRVDPGAGFEEESWSLSEKRWLHRRTLKPIPGGTEIEDFLEFEPRLLAPVFRTIVPAIFRRRHRRLIKLFGEV